VFTSVPELEERAIMAHLDNHNADSKPFAWTKTASQIFEKVSAGRIEVQNLPREFPRSVSTIPLAERLEIRSVSCRKACYGVSTAVPNMPTSLARRS
jgi:hypothetical protein